MGDQCASVRLLYTVPDLRNLPSLDVQILVNSVADDPVAGAVQHLGQGVKLALFFRGNTYGKDTLCHTMILRGAGVIMCNLAWLEGIGKGCVPARCGSWQRTAPKGYVEQLRVVAVGALRAGPSGCRCFGERRISASLWWSRPSETLGAICRTTLANGPAPQSSCVHLCQRRLHL